MVVPLPSSRCPAEGNRIIFEHGKWSIYFLPNAWQMMTFLTPLDVLIPKIPFSFFGKLWVRITSGARGSVSVGFWGRRQLSPFGGGGGVRPESSVNPPAPTESPAAWAAGTCALVLFGSAPRLHCVLQDRHSDLRRWPRTAGPPSAPRASPPETPTKGRPTSWRCAPACPRLSRGLRNRVKRLPACGKGVRAKPPASYKAVARHWGPSVAWTIAPGAWGAGGFGKKALLTGPFISYYELLRRRRRSFFFFSIENGQFFFHQIHGK